VKGKHVEVNPLQYNDEKKKYVPAKPTYTYQVQKVFVGNSYENKKTRYSGAFGKGFNGNSILLSLKGNEYIYIGNIMYSFETLYPVTQYYSYVGNNDVPYPFAVDTHKNVYLMEDHVILFPGDAIDPKTGVKSYDIDKDDEKDPYQFYYYLMVWSKEKDMGGYRMQTEPGYCSSEMCGKFSIQMISPM
jgi:hypothetical protein